MNDHVGARSRRNDDRAVGLFEHGDRVSRDLPGLIVEAGVVGRLAAAGLVRRHVHLAAGAFEHTDHGQAGGRIDVVDEARMKELDAVCHVAKC